MIRDLVWEAYSRKLYLRLKIENFLLLYLSFIVIFWQTDKCFPAIQFLWGTGDTGRPSIRWCHKRWGAVRKCGWAWARYVWWKCLCQLVLLVTSTMRMTLRTKVILLPMTDQGSLELYQVAWTAKSIHVASSFHDTEVASVNRTPKDGTALTVPCSNYWKVEQKINVIDPSREIWSAMAWGREHKYTNYSYNNVHWQYWTTLLQSYWTISQSHHCWSPLSSARVRYGWRVLLKDTAHRCSDFEPQWSSYFNHVSKPC